MGFIIKDKPKELPPEGTHTAVLFSIVDFGTQKKVFKEDVKFQHSIRLDWELSEEKMSDGRPFAIGRDYTASLGKKAKLAELIKAWTGAEPTNSFDISILLGRACNLTIMHSEDGYANITAVAPLKKSEKAPPPVNPLREFQIENYKAAVFEKLPDWMKEKIKASPEYLELGKKPEPSNNDAPVDLPNDDVPF